MSTNTHQRETDTPTISLTEAYNHLRAKIDPDQPGAKNVLRLAKWAAATNEEKGNSLIAYIREENNIGYTVEEYRSMKRKPNFLVISLLHTAHHRIGTLHLDIYLNEKDDPSLGHILVQHPFVRSRWLLQGEGLQKVSEQELQALFKLALLRRFNIEFEQSDREPSADNHLQIYHVAGRRREREPKSTTVESPMVLQGLEELKEVLNEKKAELIGYAKDRRFTMDQTDRDEILTFLEKGLFPPRAKTVQELLKHLLKSAYSYHRVRNYLTGLIGRIPSQDLMPECLNIAFGEPAFLEEKNWTPQGLYSIAVAVQDRERYDLDSREYNPRMLAVLLSGSRRMSRELSSGIDVFYARVESGLSGAPARAWEFVNHFPKQLPDRIMHMGYALTCDFLKGVGFTRLIKPDVHLRRKIASLISRNMVLSDREVFVEGIRLADKLDISPFHLDYLLYQMGHYGIGSHQHKY